MARKFNDYRVVDGRTRFAASDMNPRFEDLDIRIHAQEVLEKDFKGAINEVAEFGIERIDSFVGPAQDELDAKIAAAQDALDAAESLLNTLEADQLPISQIDGLQGALDGKATSAQGAKADTALQPSWATKTEAYSASAGDRLQADTSGGAFAITLPASPSAGDEVWFADPGVNWATNNLTVNGNGNNIAGAATFTGDLDKGHFIAVYNGTAWAVRFAGGDA